MNSCLILLFLGSVILADANLHPTEPSADWREQMMASTKPSLPDWIMNKLPGQKSRLPTGYFNTDDQMRRNELAYLEKMDRERGNSRAQKNEADEINMEKRRNLLVGRYGFRIGKRSDDENLNEDDYRELLSETEQQPEHRNFVQ
ncbi:hypothetical protein GCK72_023928 [Caenorhabditis remanei]|nr:hypothetical protein GCK72_023928 [Caenorhabditis remanei]KAF1747466.1 hypothetical protein GCK72_023928 [Caenorhabditis remanei]